jgi:hypothetical protein
MPARLRQSSRTILTRQAATAIRRWRGATSKGGIGTLPSGAICARRRSAAHHALAPMQEVDDLLVARLIEVQVEGTDPRKGAWGFEDDGIVHLAAPALRMAASAALAVAPVASPSSTTMAVRPAGDTSGRCPR